ncbi:hypothetical protein T4B_13929 [Trichinella pseudospiralis]|uniref:Uncharacterized protein n=1 Tax=Trichinella pseudospiralis TaxID=6337 RepID=A0A0V1GH69_TRIPS|nr:hypothetical protein T4A_2208 [Trichinella pseudospiralis]KRY97545.1 hypothetical protein T4B_13929 [Trichinella pseudospiralis]
MLLHSKVVSFLKISRKKETIRAGVDNLIVFPTLC